MKMVLFLRIDGKRIVHTLLLLKMMMMPFLCLSSKSSMKNDQFTKTGSGQAPEEHLNELTGERVLISAGAAVSTDTTVGNVVHPVSPFDPGGLDAVETFLAVRRNETAYCLCLLFVVLGVFVRVVPSLSW
jgi:hypothetical protein